MADFGDVTWRWAFRRALTKFLLSEHNLMVERGRYLRPALAREARLCRGCLAVGVAVLDDERHALDDCQCVSAHREAFWTQVCRAHIDSSWRDGGVSNLIVNMHGLQRHRRRQVWHSLAVFVQEIARVRAAEEAAGEMGGNATEESEGESSEEEGSQWGESEPAERNANKEETLG